jgi:hypothetical protein
MSVQTGIAPQALLALDAPMFAAMVEAADERWPLELELQAQLVELASAQLVAFVQAHSERRVQMEPLTVPRPSGRREQDGPARGERLGVGELARLPGLTAKLTEAG